MLDEYQYSFGLVSLICVPLLAVVGLVVAVCGFMLLPLDVGPAAWGLVGAGLLSFAVCSAIMVRAFRRTRTALQRLRPQAKAFRPETVSPFAYGPSGRYLVATADDELLVFDAETQEARWTTHLPARVAGVRVSGEALIAVDCEGVLHHCLPRAPRGRDRVRPSSVARCRYRPGRRQPLLADGAPRGAHRHPGRPPAEPVDPASGHRIRPHR